MTVDKLVELVTTHPGLDHMQLRDLGAPRGRWTSCTLAALARCGQLRSTPDGRMHRGSRLARWWPADHDLEGRP